MRFKLKGQQYGVYFSYHGKNTIAELIRFEQLGDDENKLEPMNTNIIGEAKMYYKDKIYSKIKGRKVALAKLLKRMNQKSAGAEKPEFRLTKKTRERIWKVYLATHRK